MIYAELSENPRHTRYYRPKNATESDGVTCLAEWHTFCVDEADDGFRSSCHSRICNLGMSEKRYQHARGDGGPEFVGAANSTSVGDSRVRLPSGPRCECRAECRASEAGASRYVSRYPKLSQRAITKAGGCSSA